MESISIDSLLSKKDYLNFCRFRSYYLNKASRNLLVFPLLLALFAIMNFVLKNTVLGWILLVLALLIPLWMSLSLRGYAIKEAKNFGLEKPRVVYSFRLNNEAIHVENNHEKADYQWSQVWKLFRTKQYFYLYMTPQRAFIIPIEGMESGEEEQLWTLAGQRMAAEKLVQKKPWYEKG
ncbi:MAG: YcxB family protein [Oscillospiraceae bacterium]|nr:YcxB family protein [Oscillospiraceae bacterium]